MKLTGKVTRRAVNPGSKSERAALLLVAGDESLALRRQDGPAWGDKELDALEGKTIEAEGERAGATFVMKRWREV